MEGNIAICKNITLNLKGTNENNAEENYIPQKNINYNPNSISKKETEYINRQMKKCICKIELKHKSGTGFFCNVPFPDPDNSNLLPVLITSYNVLGDYEIFVEKKMKLLISDYYSFTIFFDNSRLIYTNENDDITIIEIKKDDNPNICGIEIDYDFYQTLVPNNKLPVYLLFYSSFNFSECLFGVVNNKTKDNRYIQYTYLKGNNSEPILQTSGSPIINLKNFKVIGIHKNRQINKKYYMGSIIKWQIEEFKKVYEIIFQNNNNNKNDSFILKNINDLQEENEELTYDTIVCFELPKEEKLVIPCTPKTLFSFIVHILYTKYPQYYDKDNKFIKEENKEEIDPNKTINENNCGDGNLIKLINNNRLPKDLQHNQNIPNFNNNSNNFNRIHQSLMNNINDNQNNSFQN